eukprot:728613-Prorocentrum_minimum.AAC.1
MAAVTLATARPSVAAVAIATPAAAPTALIFCSYSPRSASLGLYERKRKGFGVADWDAIATAATDGLAVAEVPRPCDAFFIF